MLTRVAEGAVIAVCTVVVLLALGWAVSQGWLLPMGLGLLVLGYGALALFSVGWTIQMGAIGTQKEATFVAKLLYWHGLSLVVTLMLAAAGSIMLLFGRLAFRGF